MILTVMILCFISYKTTKRIVQMIKDDNEKGTTVVIFILVLMLTMNTYVNVHDYVISLL